MKDLVCTYELATIEYWGEVKDTICIYIYAYFTRAFVASMFLVTFELKH